MKKRIPSRSIDTPWGDDYIFLTKKFLPLRTYKEIYDEIVYERWTPPTDDESGWWPIRPNQQPPKCKTCGYQYSWGDQRLYQRCSCERRADSLVVVKTFAIIAGIVGGLLILCRIVFSN
jgi:hypothetical protein